MFARPAPPGPKPTPEPATGQQPHLQIEGVGLFPHDDKAIVQVKAVVNGTTFAYPTNLEGVQWLKVGPSMAAKYFALPSGNGKFDLRFEMLVKRGSAPVQRLASVEVVSVPKLPVQGKYALYPIGGMTRDANIAAEVRYSVIYR